MNYRENNPPTSIKFTPEQRDWLRAQLNEVPNDCKLTVTDIIQAAIEAARTQKTVTIVVIKTAYEGSTLDFLRRTKKVVDDFKSRVRDVKAAALFGDEECRKRSWELVTETDHLFHEVRRLTKLVGGLTPEALAHFQSMSRFCREEIAIFEVPDEHKVFWKELLTELETLGLADQTGS